MPCLCKQCRSRSVGFFRSQQIWICTVCHLVCEFVSTILIKQTDWLTIRNGHGMLIYSTQQGLNTVSISDRLQLSAKTISFCKMAAYPFSFQLLHSVYHLLMFEKFNYEGESIKKQPNLFLGEIDLFFFDVIAL